MEEYNYFFKREFGFFVVYGFLYFLGYDYMMKEEEEEMFIK